MDSTTIKAKIAAGLLPLANGVVVHHHTRLTPGVCAGCDQPVSTIDIGVQFDTASGMRLLHVDCYVTWSEACAD